MHQTAILQAPMGSSPSCRGLFPNPLADFFRCPPELIETTLTEEPDSSPSRSLFEHSPDRALRWLNNLRREDSELRLPRDAAQVIGNLRYERYSVRSLTAASALLSSESVRRLYYHLRPTLKPSIRKGIQRVFLRDWEKIPFPEWPVDTSVERILENLLIRSIRKNKLERIPFIWFWPDGATAAAVITHDVETRAGLDCIPRLIDIDESFDIRSSFQLVPEGRYNVTTPLIDYIRERDCEINIHDFDHSGNLFGDRDKYVNKAEQINKYVAAYDAEGFRAACMYRNLDLYDKLRISYDMSVPNVAHLEPQRGGCCTVFPYFVGNILELPLTTIQDHALLNILGSHSIDLWRVQAEMILERNGLVSFIVHPDYIMTEEALKVYRGLLNYIMHLRCHNQLWCVRPGDVNRWWRERSAMKLVRDGGKYRIVGAGRQRARIAFAAIQNERIVYEIEPGFESFSALDCLGGEHA